MANKRVSELAPIYASSLQPQDLLLLADVVNHESKKLTLSDLGSYINASGSFTGTASFATTASYAIAASTAVSATSATNAATASLSSQALNAITASFAITSSFSFTSISSSHADTASIASVTSASFAQNSANASQASTASYLFFTPGVVNGTASFSITSSYVSGLVASASHATVADFALSGSGFGGSSVSSSWASQSLSASFAVSASHANVADIAQVGITTNFQSSASWASQSLSSSYALNASFVKNAETASYIAFAVPVQGVFLAITQSNLVSQLDSVNVTPGGANPVTASIQVVGTANAYYTSSVILDESVSLYVIDRFTGLLTQLDSTPIYVNLQGNISSITASISADVAGQLGGTVTGSTEGLLTGSFTSSFTGSGAGDISGSMSGSVVGEYTGSLTGFINASYSGGLTGSVTGSISATLNGTIKIPFSMMGQMGLNFVGINPESFMIFVSASSNNIAIEPSRLSRFNIYATNAQFSVTPGGPLQLTTTTTSDILAFSASATFFNASASQMIAAGSNSLVTDMDISTVTVGIKYIWTLPNLVNLRANSDAAILDIGGMPQSIVTMSISHNALTLLYPLVATSASILDCSFNSLTALPSFPSSMSYLDCTSNFISNLPDPLPAGLTVLRAGSNTLSSTPSAFPSSIISMSLDNNPDLTTILTALPSSLIWFDCSDCSQLISIPTLPVGVKYLFLQNDGLSATVEDFIISTLVGNAQTSGSASLVGNAPITNPTTFTNIATLQSRGWNVLYS